MVVVILELVCSDDLAVMGCLTNRSTVRKVTQECLGLISVVVLHKGEGREDGLREAGDKNSNSSGDVFPIFAEKLIDI